ncbi:DUF721 domain-containing protein [Pseudokordiimonas caeni]|uniref:DUF721 domain-containing protein n=1 Tax=Pseudokordiimonas caeni TaxID=2997908 RepID=UPI002811989D|nr:DciA family protein [Pseudokordiimonas caeni]
MSDKKDKPEPKQRRRMKMAKAADVAAPLVDRAVRRQGFASVEVVRRWGQIVGVELAAATLPQALKFRRGERTGGTLVVRCPSAFAPLMTHQAHRVIEAVNAYFGFQAVAALEVVQGPLPARYQRRYEKPVPPSAETVAGVDRLVGGREASPLRAALYELGLAVNTPKPKAGG